LIACPAP